MYGFGHNQQFLGYAAYKVCDNCNNTVREHVYATYSFEELYLFRKRYYGSRGSMGFEGEIICFCPTCEHGFKIYGEAVVKRQRKTKKINDYEFEKYMSAISQFEERMDARITEKMFKKSNIFERKAQLHALKEVGLHKIASRLD